MSNPSDFIIENGVLTKYCGPGGDVEIPEGVTEIKHDYWKPVFKGKNVKRVWIPQSMTVIKQSSFYKCEELEEVFIPEGVAAIDSCAFLGCKRLKNISIPKSVTTIEREAFGESGLERIEIPEGVTEVASRLFYQCAELKEVVLPNSITAIHAGAFDRCEKLAQLRIPDGVTTIGTSAFAWCKSLESLSLPEGDIEIGERAFNGCAKLADSQGMVIVKDIVFDYLGSASEVMVPDGVCRIGEGAFSSTKIKRLLVPDSVTFIEPWSLCCDDLEYISPLNPDCVMDKDVFGKKFPVSLCANLRNILPNLSDGMLKQYIVRYWYWTHLDSSLRTEIFATRQTPGLNKEYLKLTPKEMLETMVPDAAQIIMGQLEGKPGTKPCNTAAAFLSLYHGYLSDDVVHQFYSKLKSQKTGAKAVKTMEADVKLAERLGKKVVVEKHYPPAEQYVRENLLQRKMSVKDLETQVKERYSLSFADLPELWYPDGKKADPCVMGWLLIAHGATTAAGICPEAAYILSCLNPARVQRAMLALACANLGITGRSKKMYLAYPICRYADETLMADLCTKAPKWRSQVSGNDAPPLYTFRMACLYSETRAAMLFADRFGDLDKYAEIRGTDADTIRDKYLSDVGLDEKGGKVYDLGNQTVTVRLQKDLSFLVELPTSKTAKSLPKKGADADKFAAANVDFSDLKKNAQKIAKNRVSILMMDFLEGRSRKAANWKDSYLKNPLLRQVAGLLVWVQDGMTFALAESEAVTADGSAYVIEDSPIALAHPMDMSQTDLTAWQKYFTANGIKQPFEQIWEPVYDPATITEDRYEDCMIPYYRFVGRKKHGIHVEDTEFHNNIEIYFDDCEAEVERIDWLRHMIEMDHRFEVRSISFEKFTRRVNHIIAYLDRATIVERIKKDDVGISTLLPGFTLAQITEFIKVAAENNCTNVTAILLNYKNQNFAGFDPMEEFSLDL